MMLKNVSNQRGAKSLIVAPWHSKSGPRMIAVLENYLAVRTWILNGSSIECHEEKHQRFSLSSARFRSRAIQISGLVENELYFIRTATRKMKFH